MPTTSYYTDQTAVQPGPHYTGSKSYWQNPQIPKPPEMPDPLDPNKPQGTGTPPAPGTGRGGYGKSYGDSYTGTAGTNPLDTLASRMQGTGGSRQPVQQTQYSGTQYAPPPPQQTNVQPSSIDALASRLTNAEPVQNTQIPQGTTVPVTPPVNADLGQFTQYSELGNVVRPDISLENTPIPGAYDPNAPDSEIAYSNPYQQQIDDILGRINTDISNQEGHGLSVLNQQKQGALNDLAGILGARGMGTSMAGLMPGTSDIESSFATKTGDFLSQLQDKQIQQELSTLQQVGTIAESQGNLDLKAQTEAAANEIRQRQLESDLGASNLEQRQGVIDSFTQTAENIRTVLANTDQATSGINPVEKAQLMDAMDAFAQAMQDPNVTPDQLQALYMALLAKWSQSYSGNEQT